MSKKTQEKKENKRLVNKIKSKMEQQLKIENDFKKGIVRAKRPDRFDEELCFADGRKIITWHNIGCCENNYADWSSLDDTGFYEEDFSNKGISITEWEGGFKINNYAVNCYSDQNGYYSKDLEVEVLDKEGNATFKIVTYCELIE